MIGHCVGFDTGTGPAWFSGSAWFASKFKFSMGILLLVLKTTPHGKPDLKNTFMGSDLPCFTMVFRPKS